MAKEKNTPETAPAEATENVTNEMLLTRLAAAEQEIKEQKDRIALLEQAQATGSKEPAKVKYSLPDNAVFTLDKKKYRILVPAVNIPGLGIRSATDIMADPAAQKKLVDMKSGAIRDEL